VPPPITATVLVITYNHAPYVEAALESVLTQETEFAYEVIVSDDYSTDGTRDIIERIAREHPERVRLLISERNLNDNTVLRRGVEAARGRYLGLLEGDDRWLTNDKLQRQVEFLESRPDCAMCFHNVRVVYDDGTPSNLFHQDEPSPMSTPKPKPVSTLADVAQRFFIPTCSAVFRTEHLRDMPSWYDDLPAGDHPLHVFAAEHGDVGYLDAVMGEYRVHSAGLWTARGKYRTLADVEQTLEVFDVINRHLEFRYDHLISEEVAYIYRERAFAFYEDGRYKWAAISARRSLARLPLRRRITALKRIGLIAVATVRGWREPNGQSNSPAR
jgi:glycosyltransferase involved in cell wall biosynthesis